MFQLKTEPSVCAVLLTANRPEMARQAVECFRRQTYQQKRLCIVNSGPGTILDDETHEISEPCFIGADALTIGELRNLGNDASEYRPFSTRKQPDILIHWDDDDYSHPNRIAEQVALLQSSGADCVGYNEMLFWDSREGEKNGLDALDAAWLYSQPNPSYALGTSLCYWRKTWKHRPFEATSVGEDLRFTNGLKVAAKSALSPNPMEPRMIARIHLSNTSDAYRPEAMARASEWKRVPERDSYCRGIFA